MCAEWGDEARQCDYGHRGENFIGRGGLEDDFVRRAGRPYNFFFNSGVTRGRFDRHKSLNHNFAGGMRRVTATTDAAVGIALAVVG